MNYKTSVIIVNWNGELFLERCLSALETQTIKPHEIILVDNASTDKSIEIVRKFPSVRLIELDENTGFARGNNLAIEAASEESEWIALINPDAFAEPRWLEELLTAAENNTDFDVFGSKLLNANDPSLLDGVGDAYHISGLVWRIGHGGMVSKHTEKQSEIFAPCAAAALYRRKLVLDLGGFDESYFCYVEDVDLGFRFRLAGYRCLYVPQSIAHHVGSGTTGGQHSDFSIYHGHRNLVWTFVKNMPGMLFWMLLPLHLFLNLVSIIWFARRGQGRIILRSKRDAILHLPEMWRKRQEVQRSRVSTDSDIWRVLVKSWERRASRRYSSIIRENSLTVSVCIPVFNGAEYIRQAVESALEQSYQNIEVIIVDNCSTDNTEALSEALVKEGRGLIRYFQNERNIGLVANLNRCLDLAEGAYIKFLCVDDILLPECIEKMVEGFELHDSVKLVGSSRLIVDEHGHRLGVRRYKKKELVVSGSQAITRCLYGGNYIGEPTAVMFRKNDLKGWFREDLPQLSDMDMWFQLLEHGDLLNLSTPLCAIRSHAAQMTHANIKSGMLVHDNIKIFELYSNKSYINTNQILLLKHKLLMTYRIWVSRQAITTEERGVLLERYASRFAYWLMPLVGLALFLKRRLPYAR